jgi:hypothetical protein
MLTEIVVAVATAIILGVLGWLAGVFTAPKNVEEWRVQIRRATKDYWTWRTRADRELAEELQRIDEEHNERGIYHSGIRLQARQRAIDRVEAETADQLTVMSRAYDDAFRKLHRVDKVWLVWTTNDRDELGIVRATWKALFGKTASMEADILDPVIENARRGARPPEDEPS